MTARITSNWNPQRGEETQTKFSPDYQNLSTLEKLDFLNDTIGNIKDEYCKIIRQRDFDNKNIQNLKGK